MPTDHDDDAAGFDADRDFDLDEIQDSGARGPAQAAFHFALVAYLALSNMLTLARDHRVVMRLLAMSPDELAKWLDTVAAEGSVTG